MISPSFHWTSSHKLLSFLVLGLLTFDTTNANMRNRIDDNVNYRLPRHAAPTNYKLRLWPNVANKTFDGSVEITIDVSEPAHNVTLHTNKLEIQSVILENYLMSTIDVNSEIVTDKRELLIVKTNEEIRPGCYTLKIEFSGKLDGIVGFYSSSLKNGRTMVASKFQPTYARQAFPCFDEPDFKATYDITLIKPQSYVALSNMNEISKTLDSETSTEAVTFATSVPMSTYLACFVICDFAHKETEINANGIGNNFKLRSFAQKNETHKIDFAQDIGKRATEFYINYYEVPFPLPKLDMIAIPDYVSGATEHWGLITYRETSFLVDEATASAQNKINVANTIAHELAHMWFGNLVTMKWWDEVWLNEGFASYMQVKSLNAIEPSWTMLDQFLVKTLHSVLATDAKLSSHPIVQTVNTPDQITAIFDAISYNKGASVLRMLEGFTGEENFRKGVSDYLKKHKFGNTITQDLLASLEPYFKDEYPELSLAYVMDTWTKQMGYPLLTVTKEGDSYKITQSRFLLDPNAVSPNDSEFNYRWFVPVTFKTNNGINEKVLWFDNNADSVTITEKDVKWLKINNNQVGYYRVHYPLEMWQDLTEQLKAKSDQLTISDRAHLVSDAFALAEASMAPYALPLGLVAYLPAEEAYVPWAAAASALTQLSDRLSGAVHDKMKEYIQQLLSSIYDKQAWEMSNLSVIDRLLRTRILSLAARSGLPAAVEKVRSIFLEWLSRHGTTEAKNIETDLRAVVYFYGMKYASQAEWDKLWQIYKSENDVQEQAKLRGALAAPQDVEILKKYLDLAWDENNIRSQDYLTVLTSISSNPSGTVLAWDHLRTNWTQLVDRFTLNSRILGGSVQTITSTFDTEDRLKEMEAFFAQYPEAGAGAAARTRALETVRNNIAWRAARAPEIAAWLDDPQRSFSKQ